MTLLVTLSPFLFLFVPPLCSSQSFISLLTSFSALCLLSLSSLAVLCLAFCSDLASYFFTCSHLGITSPVFLLFLFTNLHVCSFTLHFLILFSFNFSDGANSISAHCVLRVLIITEDMLGSSVTVRLQNMSQEHFLSPLLGNFLEGVSAVLSVPVENVFIFNIQPDLDAAPGGILNVSFSAALPGGLFFPSEALEEQLYLNRLRLTSLTQMEVSSHLYLPDDTM